MEKTFVLQVNGQKRSVVSDPRRPLLEVLREDLQLTGAKYGCGEGMCRACTVLLDGKPATSCTTPVEDANGKKITTIEGISSGTNLHPVQQAFLSEAGFQCGYCTPGMIMSVIGLLNEKPRPSEDQILGRMESHICRCCNYPKLVMAIRQAAGAKGTR